jgi:male-specific lethal 1
VRKIHGKLLEEGYHIWFDVIDMAAAASSAGVLEAMSAAIDEADFILVCVSREYALSANCRLEAEYAHTHGKPMRYLMLQPDFTKPTGWLGMLVGASLWYNFFEGDSEEQMQQLTPTLLPIMGRVNRSASSPDAQ